MTRYLDPLDSAFVLLEVLLEVPGSAMNRCAQRMPDLAALRDYLRDEATALIDTASD